MCSDIRKDNLCNLLLCRKPRSLCSIWPVSLCKQWMFHCSSELTESEINLQSMLPLSGNAVKLSSAELQKAPEEPWAKCRILFTQHTDLPLHLLLRRRAQAGKVSYGLKSEVMQHPPHFYPPWKSTREVAVHRVFRQRHAQERAGVRASDWWVLILIKFAFLKASGVSICYWLSQRAAGVAEFSTAGTGEPSWFLVSHDCEKQHRRSTQNYTVAGIRHSGVCGQKKINFK